jgi:hypothetical protein
VGRRKDLGSLSEAVAIGQLIGDSQHISRDVSTNAGFNLFFNHLAPPTLAMIVPTTFGAGPGKCQRRYMWNCLKSDSRFRIYHGVAKQVLKAMRYDYFSPKLQLCDALFR